MLKGPGLYSNIGKKARDLLYKDYQSDHKFTITTETSDGVAITSTGIKKGDFLLADLSTKLRNKNITADIKVDTLSNVFTTITVDEPTPGAKAIFSYLVPDKNSGKLELQYLHDHAGINTSIGLTASPTIDFSGVLGNTRLALGTNLSFDTASKNLVQCNAGVCFTADDLIASLTLSGKGDTLIASYFHQVNPVCNVGAELTHSFSSNESALTIGTQHELDIFTMVKTKMDSYGKASALIQHQWYNKSLVTISGEVDTKSADKNSKIGLAIALKP